MPCFIGKIYVSFKPLKIAQAIITFKDKILYVGNEDEALKICRTLNIQEVYLKNKEVIIPGFIDSHVHLDSIGEEINQLSLKDVKSIDELKSKIREFASRVNKGWILGRGWDQEKLGRYPSREDIDQLVRDRPVLLLRICGHAALINTKLMEILGIENDILKENEVGMAISKYREALTNEEIKKNLVDSMKLCASQGVTCVGIAGLNPGFLGSLIELSLEEAMPIRVRVYIRLDGNKDPLNIMKESRIRMGFGNEFLKIMGFKIIADGALGIRTAHLSLPYEDSPDTSGYMNISVDTLKEIIKEADCSGFQMAVHAIGDRTIDYLIDAYRGVKRNIRHRIEHASVIRPEQIKEIANLKLVACVQPHFVISDFWAMDRLGIKRMKWLYPFKTMIEEGVKLSFSTDSPVEPLNPWETIYASVTRGEFENLKHFEYIKHEKLDLIESMHAYTHGSAYAMYEEDNIGSLEVGKYADFIIVDQDPFEIEIKQLKKIKVLETYVAGKKVY